MKYAEMTPENFVDLHSYCPIENSSEEFIPTGKVIEYLKSKEYARLKSQEENKKYREALEWISRHAKQRGVTQEILGSVASEALNK